MSPLDALRVATRAIIANGLRSILTTLGMVIGVGSVIVLIAVGQGANEGVRNQIKGLGTNLVFIKPGAAPASANAGARGAQGSAITLTKSDADALAAAGIPGVAGVAPQISIDVQVINGPANQGVTLIGTTPEYPTVRGSAVAEGTFLNASDVDRKALTVVLGSNVAKTLFPDGGASNSVIRVALAGGRISFNFNVAGVMAAKGGSGGGVQDDYIFVPVTTLQNRIGFVRNASGETNVNQINVQTTEGANQKAVQAAITNMLV